MKKIITIALAIIAAIFIASAQDVYYPQDPVSIGVYSTNLPSLKIIPSVASTVDVQYVRHTQIPDGTDMLEILEDGFSDFPFISVSLVPPTEGFSMSGTFRLSFTALPSGVASRRFQIVTADENIITFLQVNTSEMVLSISPSGPLFPNPADERELLLTGGVQGDSYSLFKNGTNTGKTATQKNGNIYSFGTVYEPGNYSVYSSLFGMLPGRLSLSYFNLFNSGNEYLEGLIEEDEEIVVSPEGGVVELYFESEAFYQGSYYTPLFEKMNSLGIPGKWPAGEVPASFDRDDEGEGMTFFFTFPANDSGAEKVYDTCFCFGEDGSTLIFRQPSLVTSFSGENYIGKRTYSSVNAGSFYDDVSYYDGLGYLEQTVSVKAISSSKSLVKPVVYDIMLHDNATSYLPFSMNKTDASFVPDAVSAQSQWYAGEDARPYSEMVYETGVLGRPLTSMREGKIYADSSVVIDNAYSINDLSDGVIRLVYADPASPSVAPSVTPDGFYPVNTLSVVRTVSEDCDTSYVFNDGLGRMVLSRRRNGGVNHDTYYVYDHRDSLACVIQPEGSALLGPASSAFSLDGDFSDKWCFSYEYDAWGNLSMRHVPGGGRKYYMYDVRDRMVLSTDSELMSKGWWRYTEYDTLNRITEEGLCKLINTLTINSVKNAVALITDYSDYIYGKIVLHTLTYQDSAYQTQSGFVTVSGVATYYDRDTRHNRFRLASERIYEAPLVSSGISQPSYYVERKYFYDYRGLPIQVAESASDGWTGRTSNKYDFSGNVLLSVEEHTSPEGRVERLTLQNTYDDRGRILSTNASMNGTSLLTTYSYDDLGRLACKYLNGYDMVETFSYNLQGWLTEMVAGNGGSIDICDRSLHYYDNASAPRYGGTISSLFASHYGASSYRTDYGYDNLGRLVSEVKKTGTSGTIPFSEDHFSYDTNGNLTLATRRSGTEIEAKTESYSRVGNRIDWLLIADEDEDPDQFTYDMNGAVTYDGNAHCWITNNVLGIVGEMLFEDGSFRGNRYLADGTKFACIDNDDYGTGLVYRGSMVYRSDWDEDLEDYAEHFESAAHPEGRFFAESFTPSGQPVLSSWHYVTDHLGSTVALVDMDMMAAEDEDAASERNEFSAYGSRIGDPTLPRNPDNRYRFNGKEEVEDTPAPYIDYGARVYSPTIRQWLSPDPLADKYPDISPYAFCNNDPVNRVDPQGDSIAVLKKDKGEHIALLIQHEKDDGSMVWKYYSVNGDNVYFSHRHTGGRYYDNLGAIEFNSVQEFLDSDYNNIGSKSDESVAGYVFNEAYILPTDEQHYQDLLAEVAFEQASNQPYSLNPLSPNHCGTAVQKALTKAGFDMDVNVSILFPSGLSYVNKIRPYLPTTIYSLIKSRYQNGTTKTKTR